MPWPQPGDKQLSEPMLLDYWGSHASLGLNELTVILTEHPVSDTNPWYLR